jgi:hypothetical protein
MKSPLLLLVCLFAVRVAGFAADAPPAPLPDQAATEALRSLDEMIARGEVGWWKSQADPSIQFLNKYSGLGGDAVTALTLNQAEQLWPAWKSVGGGLEKFGIACSVYNCLKSANEGNYNAAVMNALKDFLKYRLSKMADGVAASAAGVGLIDFALNSFGEAAMQQIADDYWFIYCRYQTQRQPRLNNYVRLITEGDGTRRGFEAVLASLDSFWDDPATDGIRGFAALKTQDPDFKVNFRTRFLKENLLPFLQMWAERERDREQTRAWLALQQLTEQLQNTVVAIDFALLDKGLGEPPAGATVDVVVQFYSPKNETRVLAQAPIAGRNRLQFPLASALSADRKLPRSFKIRLHRPGDTEATARSVGTNDFELAWNNPAGAWNRVVKPGELAYVAKQPLYTSAWSECPIVLTGEGTDNVYSLVFRRLPVGTAANAYEVTEPPGGSSADLKNGQGKIRLSHGVYLVSCENGTFVFTHGPIKIAGPATLTIPVRPAAEQAVSAPPLAGYREAAAQATSAAKQRQENQRAVYAEASARLQEYWLGTYTAINRYLATARASQEKLNQELRAPSLTYEQQRAIRSRYEPRIAEMETGKEAAERSVREAIAEEQKEVTALNAAAQQRYDAARKDLSAASDTLGNGLNAVRQKLSPVSGEFEQLAGQVVSGRLLSAPAASLDGEVNRMKQSLAKIEAELPALLQAGDALAELQSRYNQAVATAREIEINEGQTIYFNPTDYDGEIAMLGLRVEAIRNSGYLDQARALVQRAERLVEKRRERGRLMAAMRQEFEALAQEMKLPDEALWRERTAAFRARADALFGAAATAEGEDDTPAFQKLQQDLAQFFGEQSAVCGDLLPGAAKQETAYSRFTEKYEAFNRQQLWREAGPDFWQSMEQLVWSKTRARHTLTREAFALAEDTAKWLAVADTRAARGAKLAEVRAEFAPPRAGTDAGSEVERLNRLDATLRAWPSQLVRAERQAWQTARVALVRGGQVGSWLRAQNRPYVQFAMLDDQDAKQPFFWPEKAMKDAPRTATGMSVCLALENAPEDTTYLMQESRDGGKVWRTMTMAGGRWRAFLQWQPGSDYRVRAILPDGSQTIELPAFPQYLAPEA